MEQREPEFINYGIMPDPEKEYMVYIPYDWQRGPRAPSGEQMILGKDLTEPQIRQLYEAGVFSVLYGK